MQIPSFYFSPSITMRLHAPALGCTSGCRPAHLQTLAHSIIYLCKPKSDKLSSLKTTSNNLFSTFSSISAMTFLLFLPRNKQSTEFPLVSFPHQCIFLHRQEKGANTKVPGQSSSLASAALLRASHLHKDRSEGKNLCPCSAAELQLVSLFTC